MSSATWQRREVEVQCREMVTSAGRFKYDGFWGETTFTDKSGPQDFGISRGPLQAALDDE